MPGYDSVSKGIGNLVTSSLRSDRVSTPRWIRERRRFDKEVHNRNEVNIMELEKYVYKTFREVIDLRDRVEYASDVANQRYYQKGDNK